MRFHPSWCAAAFLCTAALAGAQTPAGPEVRINTDTAGQQFGPELARLRDGRYVAVWNSDPGNDAKGQLLDAGGNLVGPEFLVNDSGVGGEPTVAAQPDGFVVVWLTENDGADIGVRGRRFDAAGVKLGAEFIVNSYTTSFQGRPIVSADAHGNFVVTWLSDLPGGIGVGVQRYHASGTPLGAEFFANTDTSGFHFDATVAVAPDGRFVVAWETFAGTDGSGSSLEAQRFDAAGVRQGANFTVNTYTPGDQQAPQIAFAPDGSFVIAFDTGTNGQVVRARRFDAAGSGLGPDFVVNTSTGVQRSPSLAVDGAGNFIVTWSETPGDGDSGGVRARRFLANGSPRGTDFVVNTYTTGGQFLSSLGQSLVVDGAGNFVVGWGGYVGASADLFLQRFGGLHPSALQVDTAGNHVWEPGESVDLRPRWLNRNGAAQQPTGTLSALGGPAGATYTIVDGTGAYPSIANNASADCGDCYQVAVSSPSARPATHWDASVLERLAPEAQGQIQRWSLHIGASFPDVASSNAFYAFIETLLHRGITSGCAGGNYCPAAATARQEMSVFVLVAKEGAGYGPRACTTPVFGDVPAASPFCRFIEELARRGVAGGCGNGNFCPNDPVTREQMSVFVLRTLDPTLSPPACGTPMFGDVPAASPFCRWIEELVRRGVVVGCGGGNYCPTQAVTREQMAVFIGVTFGLTLYGS